MSSEDRVIIRDESYPAVLLEALGSEKPGLASNSFDAVLCVGHDLEIPVHKLVFAAVSDFMGQLLKEHEVGCQEDAIGPRIILEDMKFDVLKLVVEFAYTGEASIPAPLADDIFEAAQRLGIKFLRDSFLRLDHEDYEDIRSGRKTLDLQSDHAQGTIPTASKETVNFDQSTSDTESAESFDVGESLRTGRSPGQVFSSREKKKSNENVLFTITKHQEQEGTSQQHSDKADESASYLVRFENEEPVSQEPQVTQQPQIVGLTKVPSTMQLLMPAKSSVVQQQQPRLETGQIMTIRRPDGTLVQVVAQRSRQQQQQILAPRHPGQVFHPRKMFLPKGVQIQPKMAPARDALAIAMASITDNSPQPDPKPVRTSDIQVVSMSPQPLVVATTRQQPKAVVLNRKPLPGVVGRQVQTVGSVRLPQAVVIGRQPQGVVASARQSHVIVQQPPKTLTAARQQPQIMNRKPQVFATATAVTPIRQPQATNQLPSITPDPTDSSIAISSTTKMFASPTKLSTASLTVSEPKPTFPSTVPDDFLEDSSYSEAASSDVSPSPVPTRLQDEDLSSTRKSGRERKLNRKYLDDGSEELESPLQVSKNILKKSSTTPRSTTTTTSNKRKSEETTAAPAKKLPKVQKEEESGEEHSSEEKSEKENKKVQSEKSKRSEKKIDVNNESASGKKRRVEETKEKKVVPPEKSANQRISVRGKKPDELPSESKTKKVEKRGKEPVTPEVQQSSRVTRRSDVTSSSRKMPSRGGQTYKSPEKRSMRIKKK